MQLPFHENASPRIFENARSLKRKLTPTEKILWKELRGRRFKGFKFRRQHPFAKYVLDFYCHEAKLVIEVDGEIHNQPEIQEYDQKRTQNLEALHLKVIRFTNEAVKNNLNSVLLEIEKHLTSSPPFSSQEKGQG